MSGGRLAQRDVPRPAVQPGAAIVQVFYAGMCGSDVAKLHRPHRFDLPETWRPGHEIVGQDESGRAVIVDPLVPCGDCQQCASGDMHCCGDLRRIGWDLPGGFADQLRAPKANLRSLPATLDLRHAVLADPAAVAVHGVRCAPIGGPGQLAVLGAGQIGLLTAAYAAQIGWDVTVFRRTRDRGDPPIDGLPIGFQLTTSKLDAGRFDAVIDAATGDNSEPLEHALRLVCTGGTVIVQNAYDPNVTLPTPLREVFRRSVQLVGSFSYCARNQPDDLDEAIRLLQRIPQLADFLTRDCWPSDELHVVLDALRSRRVTKAILRFPAVPRRG